MMLGHDSPKVQDMTLKGSAEGKTYVGPAGDPSSADDREVVGATMKIVSRDAARNQPASSSLIA